MAKKYIYSIICTHGRNTVQGRTLQVGLRMLCLLKPHLKAECKSVKEQCLSVRAGFVIIFSVSIQSKSRGYIFKCQYKIFNLGNRKVIYMLRVIRCDTVFLGESRYHDPFHIILVLCYITNPILKGKHKTSKPTSLFVCDLYIYIQRCTEIFMHTSGKDTDNK